MKEGAGNAGTPRKSLYEGGVEKVRERTGITGTLLHPYFSLNHIAHSPNTHAHSHAHTFVTFSSHVYFIVFSTKYKNKYTHASGLLVLIVSTQID